jgi:hypothetical protein
MANNTLVTMKDSLSKLSSVLVMPLDVTPVVTPVLDLTSFRKDAGQIGGILSSSVPSIVPTTSTNNATDVAEYVSTRNDQGSDSSGGTPPITLTYVQNNTSPKALSSADIYRQTKNQLSTAKGVVGANQS